MIVRVAERRRYTVIDNQPIEDERLTFKALGVLTYLLSRPDNWTASCQQLATTHREKGYAIRQALSELETHGYITRRREHDPETGHFQWVQEIHERQVDEGDHDAVSAHHDAVSHTWVTHTAEIAPLISTEVTNPEEQENNATSADSDPSLEAEKVNGKPGDTSSEDEFKRTFAIMWEAYPPRDGKRLGEKQALQQWRKLSLGDRRAAHRGAKNLAEAVAAGGRFGVPDLHRWLRDRRWEEWQEPAKVEGNGKRDFMADRQAGWVPRLSETHTWKVDSL